ncbi:SGNH/GDSL hydrolase family protein [Pedobacter hartonius]|uniref:SGNH/GDSL hydrolase family protein n=1 Tax=Pedobacter hartonius TaxID=425514 RepID=UPI00373FDE04
MKNSILILILLVLHVSSVNAQSVKQNFNIVFIGNSITHGSGLPDPETQAPPVIAAQKLRAFKDIGTVQISNVGRSGSTTLDWLPENNKLFPTARQAAGRYATDSATLLFSIVLGTNDSAIKGPHGAPVSPEDYHGNLIKIADRLLAEYPKCKIIFQYPTWYSENTYNTSKYLKEGLNRLQSYLPEIDAVVKSYKISQPNTVFSGNKKVFAYFKKHRALFQNEKGQQGIFNLHPNVEGAAELGNFWAKAIYKALESAK